VGFCVVQSLLELVSSEQIANKPELVALYQKEEALHICYKVAYEDRASRLEQAERDLYAMLNMLQSAHEKNVLWQQCYRVFSEHFTIAEDAISHNVTVAP
jgi:hypothetical protein